MNPPKVKYKNDPSPVGRPKIILQFKSTVSSHEPSTPRLTTTSTQPSIGKKRLVVTKPSKGKTPQT